MASGKGELESQHSGNLGALSKAEDSTLLELGLSREEEWASNTFSFNSALTFVFPAQGRQRREEVGLFGYLHALVLLHSPELLSVNPFHLWDN